MSKRETLCLSIGGVPVATSRELTKLLAEAKSRGLEINDYSYVARYVREYGLYSGLCNAKNVFVIISKVEQI